MALARRTSPTQEIINSVRLSPIPSIVTDPRANDNPIIAANRAFERLTGYSENELVGRNCRILGGPDTDPVKRAALREAVASATPAMIELVNYRKDGSKFLNAVMIAPVLDDDRRLACFVGSQMEVDRAPAHGLHSSAAERLTVLSRKISFSVALQLFASSHQSGPVAIFPHDRSPSNCGLRLMTSITEGPECLYRLDLFHSSFFLCLSFSLVFPSLLAQPSRAFAIKRALRVSLDTRTIPLQW